MATIDERVMYVCICGNLSEGFKIRGPYFDFDDAAADNEEPDTWIMPMSPGTPTPSGRHGFEEACHHALIRAALNMDLYDPSEIAAFAAYAYGDNDPLVKRINEG